MTSQSLVLFFRVVGTGTDRFSRLKSGDKVIVWGPLGTSFDMRPDTPTLLLARGVGIAPFAGYADVHPAPASLFMLFGHGLPSNNYPTDAMAARMEMVNMRDRTPEELEQFHRVVREKMLEYKEHGGICLACGPMPFLKRVWERALELDLPTQLSLEERMACGTGACATAVAAVLNGHTDREVDIVLRGGTLHIRWDENTNHVMMTGPARFVCDGTFYRY